LRQAGVGSLFHAQGHHQFMETQLLASAKANQTLSDMFHNWLVVLTILKNMKVSWDDYPIYYGK
jgi:hypothetical protein